MIFSQNLIVYTYFIQKIFKKFQKFLAGKTQKNMQINIFKKLAAPNFGTKNIQNFLDVFS